MFSILFKQVRDWWLGRRRQPGRLRVQTLFLAVAVGLTTANCRCENSATLSGAENGSNRLTFPSAPSGSDVLSTTTNQSNKVDNPNTKADGLAGAVFIPPPQPNNYGGVSLQYAIDIPPGRAGVQPQVSLSYSSSGGDGWVGMGWSLGLGSISRTTQYGQLYYDHRDTFTFGGKRLIKVAGPTDSEAGTYRLEIESSFDRLELTQVGSGGVWTVYKSDGSRVIYGQTVDHRIVRPDDATLTYTWQYSKTIDRNGNYMYAVYDDSEYEEKHILYLKEIWYTGNEDTSFDAYQYVRFHLKNRPDSYISKAPGFIMQMDKMLDSIEVGWKDPDALFNGEETLWSYQLVYETSPDSYRPLLKTVESDHHTTEPEFHYQPAEHYLSWQQVYNPAQNDLEEYPDDVRYFEGDFNGDGISDMVYFNRLTGNWKAIEGRPEGGYLYKTYGQTPQFANLEPGEMQWFKGNVTGDFDGNGRSDIAFYMTSTKTFWVAQHNGIVFDFVNYGVYPFNDFDILRAEWFPGDYDGNGLSDAILYDEASGDWVLMTNEGGRFEFVKFLQKFKNLFREDYNPDGNMDSITTEDDSEYGLDRDKVHFLNGDYNGDGRTDISIYDQRSGKWFVAENYRDDTFGFKLEWRLYKVFTAPEGALFGHDRFSGDFNGDGLSDFLVFDRDSGEFWIGETSYDYANGQGTINFRIYATAPQFREITRWLQGDFNGDGRTDIGFYSKDDNNFWIGEAVPDGFRFRIYTNMNLGPDPDKVFATPLPLEGVELADGRDFVSSTSASIHLEYKWDRSKGAFYGERIFNGCFTASCGSGGTAEQLIYNRQDEVFHFQRGTESIQENVISSVPFAGLNINKQLLEKGLPFDYDGDGNGDLLFKDSPDETNKYIKYIAYDGTDFNFETLAHIKTEGNGLDNIDSFTYNKSRWVLGDFDSTSSDAFQMLVLDDLNQDDNGSTYLDTEAYFYIIDGTSYNRLTIDTAGITTDPPKFKKLLGSGRGKSGSFKFLTGRFTNAGTNDPYQLLIVDNSNSPQRYYFGEIDLIGSEIVFIELTPQVGMELNFTATDFGPGNRLSLGGLSAAGVYGLNAGEFLYAGRGAQVVFNSLVIDGFNETISSRILGSLPEGKDFQWQFDHTGKLVIKSPGTDSGFELARVNGGTSLVVESINFDDAAYHQTKIERPDLINQVYPFRWIQGDYNGDGKTDIGFFHMKEPKWYFANSVGTVPDMIDRIDNGIGGYYKLEYENSSRFSHYGDDNIPDLPMNYKVCTAITVADGQGKEYKNRYEYQDGYAFSAFIDGKKETDYFGFSRFTIIDALGGKVIQEYYTTPYADYRQNRALAGALKKKTVIGNDIREYQSETFEYTVKKINQGGIQASDSYLIQPTLKEEYMKGVKIRTTTNALSITANTYELNKKTVTVTDHYSDSVHSEETVKSVTQFETVSATAQQRVLWEKNLEGTQFETKTEYEYDTNGNVDKTIFKYTGSGLAAPPADRVTVTEYNSYGLPSATEDQSATPYRRSETTYDSKLHQFPYQSTQKGPNGDIVSSSTYNYGHAFGQVEESTDPNGNQTYTTFDSYGRLTKIETDTDGGVKTLSDFSYSADYPLSANTVQYSGTGAADIATRVFHDGLGRHIHSIQSALTESGKKFTKTGQTVYDPLGRVIRQSQVDWAENDTEIDSYIPHAKNNERNPTITEYDGSGRVKKVTGPPAYPDEPETSTTYTYNDPYETIVMHSGGQNKRTVSNGRGHLLYVEDYGTGDVGGEVSAEMGFCYDLAGRRIKRMDLNATTLTCTIPGGIFTAGVRDNTGHNISYWAYDGFGQQIYSSDPDFGYSATTYTAFGEVASSTDALGRTTNFTYDKLGRVTEKDKPSPDSDVTYEYDTLTGSSYSSDNIWGRMTVIEDGEQRKEFSYNKRGQLKEERRSYIGLTDDIHTADYITKYQKDLLNRDIIIDYPEDPRTGDHVRVCYSYNSMGYISGVDANPTGTGSDCSDTNKVTLVSSVDYNEYGQMTEVVRGNGTVTTYSYDEKGRLTNLLTTNTVGANTEKLQDVTYTFKVNNSIKKVENNPLVLDGGSLTSKFATEYEYKYDGLNRLVDATGSYDDATQVLDFHRGFSYAQNGNLTGKTIYNTGTGQVHDQWTYAYDNHAVTEIATTLYGGNDRFEMTYNAVGSMISQEDHVDSKIKNMVYDSNNRIVAVHNPNETGFANTVGQYFYDDQGFRVRKLGRREVDTGSGPEMREYETLYPSMYFGIERQNDDTGAEISGSYNTVNNIYIDGVRIAALAPNGSGQNVRYYLTDQVDSVKLVLDEDANVTTRLEYYPYGEAFIEENYEPGEDHSPKYNSQELDKETGYYFYNARHYDAQIARFVTADTVIDGWTSTVGWNRFAYVHNNPVRYKDPTGHGVIDSGIYKNGLHVSGDGKSSIEPGSTADQESGFSRKLKAYQEAQKNQDNKGYGGNSIGQSAAVGCFGGATGSNTYGCPGGAHDHGKSFKKIEKGHEVGAKVTQAVVEETAMAATGTKAAGVAIKASSKGKSFFDDIGDLFKNLFGGKSGKGSSFNGNAGANNATDGIKLKKKLASEGQMAEATAGVGETMAGAGHKTTFRGAQKAAERHGGKAEDWMKKTSSSFKTSDGSKVETHWIQNDKIGKQAEFKTKMADE